MHSFVLWPALIVLGGTAASAPMIEDAGNRSLLYWLLIPSLLVGVAAMCSNVVGQ